MTTVSGNANNLVITGRGIRYPVGELLRYVEVHITLPLGETK